MLGERRGTWDSFTLSFILYTWSEAPHTWRVALFNVEDEAFEVFAFGMVDVDRMVGGLGELMEDAHLAARHCSCSEDGEAELLFGDGLRTGEGEEDASGRDFFKSCSVESAVADHCVADCTAVFGESGWVEDDEVVCALFHASEEFESILSV